MLRISLLLLAVILGGVAANGPNAQINCTAQGADLPDRIRYGLLNLWASIGTPDTTPQCWTSDPSVSVCNFEGVSCFVYSPNATESPHPQSESPNPHSDSRNLHSISRPFSLRSATVGVEVQFWELQIGGENLTGVLPVDVWKNFTGEPSLLAFSLPENQLTGTLPSEISMLADLQYLNLAGNDLTGELPASWGVLTQLEYLVLQGNDFTSTLPSTYASMRSMLFMGLYECGLYGTIPQDFSGETMQKILFLGLYGNKLTGTIPSTLGTLTSLTILTLHDNQLSGTIPSTLRNIPSLTYLHLANNRLEGDIPPLRVSQVLNLAGNDFSGSGSAILNTLATTGANVVTLSDNQRLESPFSVPPELWPRKQAEVDVLKTIVTLEMSGCNVSGELIPGLSGTAVPDSVLNSLFLSLQVLDVSHNTHLTGEFPLPWITGSTAASLLRLAVENTSLSPNPVGWRFVAHSAVPFGDFECESVNWDGGVGTERERERETGGGEERQLIVQGLKPVWWNYEACTCATGYEGTVPMCRRVHSHTLAITLPLVALSAFLITLSVVFARKVYRRRWRERRARRLLENYAGMKGRHFGKLDDAEYADSVVDDSAGQLSGDDLEIPFRQIEMVKLVAHGASGAVYLGIWRTQKVAVKQFWPGIDMDFADFSRECSVHKRLRHPNIVLLLGICQSPFCTVSEWMERGSLFHVIQHSYTDLTPERKMGICLDIVRGMVHLHSLQILHRDLKSLNVLLDVNWRAKVADFGASRFRDDSNATMTMGIGTVAWMAPETFSSGHYTEKCDVYSFGIILWEIYTGKPPFEELITKRADLAQMIISGERPRIRDEDEIPRKVVTLMRKCWSTNPGERPTFERILSDLEKQAT